MNTKHISAESEKLDFNDSIFGKLYHVYLLHVDGQQKNHLLWFLMALMIHGVFFLASPAILIGFFNAPITVLAVTILTFFINLIGNMGGAGIRTTLTLFYLGILVNLSMILIYAF